MKNKIYLNDFNRFIKSNRLFTNIFVVVSFILSVVVILFFNYFIDAFFAFNQDDFKVGEPAKRDYVLKADLNYFNEFETNIAKEVEEKLVLPLYLIDKDITATSISNFEAFYKTILNLKDSQTDINVIYLEFESIIPGVFNKTDVDKIIDNDPNLLFSLALTELEKLLSRGFISSVVSNFDSGSGLINVVSTGNTDNYSQNISAISVLRSIDVNKSLDSAYVPFVYKLVKAFILVNCYYDNEQTKHNRALSLSKVKPVIDLYRRGEVLVLKDFVVNQDVNNKINQAEVLVKRNTFSNVLLVLGFVLSVYIAGLILFNSRFIQIQLKESDIILLVGVTLFYIVISVLIRYFLSSELSYLFPLVIPSVLLSMLITFLLNDRVGVYLSVLFSFLILLISDFSISAFSITLIMSIFGTIIVHDVEKRIDLLKSSGELALIQTLLTLYLFSVGIIQNPDIFLLVFVSISSSLISGVLTLALLPLSEHLLKISTCFQLTELCDLNAPLLKSMLIKAPGTYAHSIAVANMAESAAQHIGSNPLLAKAGGYYHDIGKIDQPHYFIENQKGGKNLHDDMKPSLSVAVIKSHVKLGIEKAKNIGLPSDIIDIIEQHHGKGSIAFFLDKAKKERKGNTILTEDFAYSGPNPQSPEAAIVMLADSVEAAVRSLKNPTISQLDKFVWDLILNKLKEGMLDACGLTLSDLTTIKNSFINTLMGHYHSRIEYPSGDEKK
ncbi:MAG: HDIG domain-containing protein [Spirochaetaceae bacterium]